MERFADQSATAEGKKQRDAPDDWRQDHGQGGEGAQDAAQRSLCSRKNNGERDTQHECDRGRGHRTEEGKAERGRGLGRDQRRADLAPGCANDESRQGQEKKKKAGRRQRQHGRRDPRLAHTVSNPAPDRIA